MNNETAIKTQKTEGILWSIDENGVLRIAKAPEGNGNIPVRPMTDSKTIYNDEGYENTTFTFEGVFHKPWTYEQREMITEVIVEEGIIEIPFGCFSNLINCTRIHLPDTIDRIDKWAFRSCEKLEEIDLPEKVRSIEEECFLSCKSLRHIALPESLLSIGKKAFAFCDSLKEIDLLEGLTSIGEEAFYACYGLESVTIPDSVTQMGKGAFKSCRNMHKAYVPKDKIKEFAPAFDKYETFRDYDGTVNVMGTNVYAKKKDILGGLFKKNK